MSIPRLIHAVRRVLVRSAAVLIGVLPFQAGTGVQAQEVNYRSPESAPPAWGKYAALIKQKFEERVAADEPLANRFRVWLTETPASGGAPPVSTVVRVWLNADGTVSQVSFPGLGNGQADDDLRTILMRGNIGQTPPADMLQPLHLRFMLRLPA